MQYINGDNKDSRENKDYNIVATDGSRIMRDGEIRMLPRFTLSASDNRYSSIQRLQITRYPTDSFIILDTSDKACWPTSPGLDAAPLRSDFTSESQSIEMQEVLFFRRLFFATQHKDV